MMRREMTVLVAVVAAMAGLCRAQTGEVTPDRFASESERPDLTLRVPEALSGPRIKADEPAPARFGDKNSQWWTIGIGMADNLANATDFNVRGAWSRFIIQDVEFSLELNGWYFNQAGDNALGINPAFVFRYHFVNTGSWTVFTDAGIGLLFATDNVPDAGTSFDFMPRAGMGFTYQIDERGDRLQVGLRWHHISNARIEGDVNNPSRDAIMIYAGIEFPF